MGTREKHVNCSNAALAVEIVAKASSYFIKPETALPASE